MQSETGMNAVRDLIEKSSVGTRAQTEAGHPPRTVGGRLDIGAIRRAYASTWVDTLVNAAYYAGYADGAEAARPEED